MSASRSVRWLKTVEAFRSRAPRRYGTSLVRECAGHWLSRPGISPSLGARSGGCAPYWSPCCAGYCAGYCAPGSFCTGSSSEAALRWPGPDLRLDLGTRDRIKLDAAPPDLPGPRRRRGRKRPRGEGERPAMPAADAGPTGGLEGCQVRQVVGGELGGEVAADLVVGGYTGVPGHPQSLLLGAYDAGQLQYVGNTTRLTRRQREELVRVLPRLDGGISPDAGSHATGDPGVSPRPWRGSAAPHLRFSSGSSAGQPPSRRPREPSARARVRERSDAVARRVENVAHDPLLAGGDCSYAERSTDRAVVAL